MSEVNTLLPVTFSEPGVVGPTGLTGATGPMGGSPNVNGTAILDPNVLQFRGPYTVETTKRVTLSSGAIQTVASSYDPLITNTLAPCKVTFECKAQNAVGSVVQTLDGNRVITLAAGVPTIATSGSDVPYDPSSLGVVWTIEIYSPGGAGTYALRIRATGAAGYICTASIRELY